MKLSTFIMDNIDLLLQKQFNYSDMACNDINNKKSFRSQSKEKLLAIALELELRQPKKKSIVRAKTPRIPFVEDVAATIHEALHCDEVLGLKEIVAEYRMLRANVMQSFCMEKPRMNPSDLNDLMYFNDEIDRLLEESIYHYTLLEEKLLQRAYFDDLTGLPNRRLFRDRLNQAIKYAKREDKIFALLWIDLDRFKEVNDRFGHAAGDLVLQHASARIIDCVRETDTVARVGGDEFSVILMNVRDAAATQMISEKILKELAKPFQIEQQRVCISGSIGITLCPRDGAQLESLLRNADKSMYLAKKSGFNQLCFHDDLLIKNI